MAAEAPKDTGRRIQWPEDSGKADELAKRLLSMANVLIDLGEGETGVGICNRHVRETDSPFVAGAAESLGILYTLSPVESAI